MYQVLYRKWRPRTFSDVSGQPQVTVTLQNELKAGRVAHAYLFTGSRGTGKTPCAKILAKAINCLDLRDGDPCGECAICRGIDDSTVLDIVEIDAASNNGVDNIRDLREEANFTPANAKYRVYIIDEVHMLSIGAFNALLKTLEEPPAHVVFILATTEVHKLPATILSRCQRFDFHRIAPEIIADRLEFVCQEEKAEITRDAALLIARLADGALRDALSLLDQCLGRSRSVTQDVVIATAGMAGRDHLFALANAFYEKNCGAALEIIDNLYAQSKDMARLCEELIAHFRNIMLLKTMKDPQKILTVSDGEYAQLEEQAHCFSLEAVLHCLDRLQSSQERMFRGGNRRVEMETAAVHLCSPELDTSPDALLRRMKDLEATVRGEISARPARKQPVAEEEPVSEPEVKTPSAGGAKPSTRPQEPIAEPRDSSAGEPNGENAPVTRLECWPEILTELHKVSPSLCAYMNDSVAYVCGKYVLIDAPNSMAFDMLRSNPDKVDKMRQAISKVTGTIYRLGPYKPSQDAEAVPKEEAGEDQLKLLMQKAAQAGVETTSHEK